MTADDILLEIKLHLAYCESADGKEYRYIGTTEEIERLARDLHSKLK